MKSLIDSLLFSAAILVGASAALGAIASDRPNVVVIGIMTTGAHSLNRPFVP